MPAYGVTNTSATVLSIKAITYQIRIVKVEWQNGAQVSALLQIFRYAGATQSGGTTAAVVPLRDGAPASSVTAKTGATISGTSSLTHYESMGAVAQSGGYQYPLDFILSPGNAVHVLASNATNMIAVYFEELRLARST